MKKELQRWTREQTIIVFNLYCKIPFNRASSSHPDIVEVAKAIGRSANSVKMKIGNFGSFDPELKRRGIVGLANASKLDEEVWSEFNKNWDDLAFESEEALAELEGKEITKDIQITEEDFKYGAGVEKERLVKTRVNQNFFRQTILSAYNSTCCITGIDIPELLVASHIIPWSKAESNKLNPRNGLCLNALHDKAFDRGLLTIMPDYTIKISSHVSGKTKSPTEQWLLYFHNKKITTPERFMPSPEFLQYHNENIFIQ